MRWPVLTISIGVQAGLPKKTGWKRACPICSMLFNPIYMALALTILPIACKDLYRLAVLKH